jgi:hypothetical protein
MALPKLLNFEFNADPDPAFYYNADPDQTSQNNANPSELRRTLTFTNKANLTIEPERPCVKKC